MLLEEYFSYCSYSACVGYTAGADGLPWWSPRQVQQHIVYILVILQ